MSQITDACDDLVFCMKESHEEAVRAEGLSMRAHRREEPSCSYCAAIRSGEGALKVATKKRAGKMYPLSQDKFDHEEAMTIGYSLVGYLEESAPGEDDEIGGGDLVDEVVKILDFVHRGGR